MGLKFPGIEHLQDKIMHFAFQGILFAILKSSNKLPSCDTSMLMTAPLNVSYIVSPLLSANKEKYHT